MKALLLILLLGFSLSSNECIKKYIQTVVMGTYETHIFGGATCDCPAGLVGFKNDDLKKCRCYSQSQIDQCLKDKNCRYDDWFGCNNA